MDSSFVPPTEDGLQSGKYFHGKLESWGRANPLVIFASFTFDVPSAVSYMGTIDGKGRPEKEIKKLEDDWKGPSEDALLARWRIHFNIIRACTMRKPHHFDGVVHLAGVLYPDTHVEQSREVRVYVVDQASRSFRGIANYPTALAAWHCLTTLGTPEYNAKVQ